MTRQIARMLRRNPSRPEREAWALLRDLRDEGIAVRRPHPIGRYIADFAILRARLAIEVDGPLHELQRDADERRDAAFAQLGWRILRVTPAQIADGLHFLASVRAALSPSPQGEGAGGGVKPGAENQVTVSPPPPNVEACPAPQPPLLAGRGGNGAPDAPFSKHLHRRTRAHRVLPPRAKPE